MQLIKRWEKGIYSAFIYAIALKLNQKQVQRCCRNLRSKGINLLSHKKTPEAKIIKNCSQREINVYRCLVLEGMSQRQAAKKLNIHRSKIQTSIHKLRSKGININPHKKPGRKKVEKS